MAWINVQNLAGSLVYKMELGEAIHVVVWRDVYDYDSRFVFEPELRNKNFDGRTSAKLITELTPSEWIP